MILAGLLLLVTSLWLLWDELESTRGHGKLQGWLKYMEV